MKKLAYLVALVALASMPVQAGVTVSAHFGGGGGHFGGGFSSGGYRGYHCYYGGRGYGFYGGGFYGYSPYYGYASYPIGYDSGSYYGYSDGSGDPTAYAATDAAPPQPPTQAANPAAAPAGPLPAGKIDEAGYVHSPYSNTAFKAVNAANGQVFYDPTTGQPFILHVTAPATAPAPAVPSATSTSTGKLDEFGYVHSPFSTFTFKVQNGNYAQVFRDPFTGQNFTVNAPQTSAPVASAKLSD